MLVDRWLRESLARAESNVLFVEEQVELFESMICISVDNVLGKLQKRWDLRSIVKNLFLD